MNSSDTIKINKKTVLVVIFGVATLLIGFVGGQIILNSLPTTQTSTATKTVYIKVAYGNSWSGAYGDTSRTISWSGSSTTIITLQRPADATIWIIVANAQKQDGSTDTLILSFIDTSGNILRQASTSAPYGVVQLSYTFTWLVSVWRPRMHAYFKTCFSFLIDLKSAVIRSEEHRSALLNNACIH